MRSSFALALGTLSLCLASADGQTLRQPNLYRGVTYSAYYAQRSPSEASPSDLRVAANTTNLGGAAAQSDTKTVNEGHGKLDCEPASDEPCRLFPEFGCGWSLTGWIAGGATANADNPRSGYNGPTTFNDQHEVQANQVYLSFGKDVDTGGCGMDWGGRVDLLYGSDYIFTQAAGLELHDDYSRHWNRESNQYGLALPQFYAEVGYNNLKVKLGHFYTIMGYEVVTAPNNFFYSHAYTMQYGEPFTHTGGLASYEVSDQLTVHGGLVNGWDKFDAESDLLAFCGGFNYNPCHERYSLVVAFISGEEDGAALPVLGTRNMYSIVFTYNLTENLQSVTQHDNAWQEVAPGVDAEWYGLNHYLFYTINDCWKLGARWEWFRDDDGVRLSSIPLRTGNTETRSFAGDYYNISLGLNWTPTPNLTVRPEVRWDWSSDTEVQPFDDFTKDSQFLGAFDVIYLF